MLDALIGKQIFAWPESHLKLKHSLKINTVEFLAGHYPNDISFCFVAWVCKTLLKSSFSKFDLKQLRKCRENDGSKLHIFSITTNVFAQLSG